MTNYLKRIVEYREAAKANEGDFAITLPARFFESGAKGVSARLAGGNYMLTSANGRTRVRVYESEQDVVDSIKALKKEDKSGFWAQKIPAAKPTGVRYIYSSRHPYTGQNILFGFKMNGEEKVSLSQLALDTIKALTDIARDVEYLLEDVFEIEVMEFEGKGLIITGVFDRARTTLANANFSYDMAMEGLIAGRSALMKLSAVDVPGLLQPQFDVSNATDLMRGLPACAGAVSGTVVVSASSVDKYADAILIVAMTTPEDVAKMTKCKAIVTTTGGLTSHAAVIARGHGIPCIVSATGATIAEGTKVSIDGATGIVYQGVLPKTESTVASKIDTMLEWAKEEASSIKVFANADTAAQIKTSLEAGATGVGLVRTEHMLFTPAATSAFRRWALAEKKGAKAKALSELKAVQVADFIEIFKVTADKAKPAVVTVRLFDPPVHEFLPADSDTAALATLATELNVTQKSLREKVEKLHEHNPMLGHRGVRLGITNPELYAMQASAIAEAAVAVAKKTSMKVTFAVMVPLVSDESEYASVATMVREVTNKVLTDAGYPEGNEVVRFKIGAMLETPRACLIAQEIAEAGAEFFSFGTNDLTQMTFGFSRDDTAGFMGRYVERGYFNADPFSVLDDRGVARLLKMAMDSVRAKFPNVSFGICGEHGGEPRSITAALRLGINYVSCSPSRIKIALLASAQTVIADEEGTNG